MNPTGPTIDNSINPLLRQAEHPAFADIRPAHVEPALTHLLAQADAALERAVSPDVPADYESLALVLDVAVERLNYAWGQVSHLQSVVDTPELREAHAAMLPRIIDFGTRLGADERLYAKYKALAASDDAAKLNPARKKALSNALRDFVLGGAELQGAARERYAAIQDRSGALSQQFGDHVLDATDAFVLMVSKGELEGLPEEVCQAALEAANGALLADAQPAYRLSLQAPCFGPVMQYASNRSLREKLYRAYHTRASSFGPAALDNSALMQELMQLRQEEAALLGYANCAEMELAAKMAGSAATVLAFVRDLAPQRRRRPEHASQFRRRRTGPARAARLGPCLHQRKAQAETLRLQQPGGEAVLHRAACAAGPLRAGWNGVWRGHPPGCGACVAPRCALLQGLAQNR